MRRKAGAALCALALAYTIAGCGPGDGEGETRLPFWMRIVCAVERMVQWLTEGPIPDPERQYFEAITLMLPAYARRGMLERRPDNQDLLAKLTLPVLLSLGEADNPTQIEDGAEMAAAHGNVSLSVYADTGHSVFFEQPERFNTELRQLARRVRPNPD